MVFGTNSFLAAVCDRLDLTRGLFGPAVEQCPDFGSNDGVKCGHVEVFVMGLHESNGPEAAYKFLWTIFEAYGPFILNRLVQSRFAPKEPIPAQSLARWKDALFTPREADSASHSHPHGHRDGPWLIDALHLHGQEMGRPFELVRTEHDSGEHHCTVVQDTLAVATAHAATRYAAGLQAISATLTQLDYFGRHAVDLLYSHSETSGTELEFSVSMDKRTGVWTAFVHWGNGDESRVVGRGMRASSVEAQNAAAVLAARRLGLSLVEFAHKNSVGLEYPGGQGTDQKNPKAEESTTEYTVEVGTGRTVVSASVSVSNGRLSSARNVMTCPTLCIVSCTLLTRWNTSFMSWFIPWDCAC